MMFLVWWIACCTWDFVIWCVCADFFGFVSTVWVSLGLCVGCYAGLICLFVWLLLLLVVFKFALGGVVVVYYWFGRLFIDLVGALLTVWCWVFILRGLGCDVLCLRYCVLGLLIMLLLVANYKMFTYLLWLFWWCMLLFPVCFMFALIFGCFGFVWGLPVCFLLLGFACLFVGCIVR